MRRGALVILLWILFLGTFLSLYLFVETSIVADFLTFLGNPGVQVFAIVGGSITVAVTGWILFGGRGKKEESDTRIWIERVIANPNVAVGVYTGDGSDGRKIPMAGVGFTPIAVLMADQLGNSSFTYFGEGMYDNQVQLENDYLMVSGMANMVRQRYGYILFSNPNP
jgi:hypothetical protein